MAVSLLAPGFLFLFAATALLIIVSVGTPIWDPVDFLRVGLAQGVQSIIQKALPDSIADDIVGTKVELGQWGYCVGGACSSASLGYNVPPEIFGNDVSKTVGSATEALILHPIAAAISALALLFALCGNIVSGVIASIVAFFAFLVCLVALIVDVVIWTVAKNRIDDGSNVSTTDYGPAFWMVVAATILLLLASFTVCCAHHRRRRNRGMNGNGYDAEKTGASDGGATTGRRRFWQRRNRSTVV